ncbi:unnamed protein product [Brugia pahangi]|uniref:Peptidase M12B domain-containing protein n=1 Tax=Brugia pahangi TaxID=6280 RepID=A0A0N4TEB2_BRUPA|nr:unnamed protein product [Brugia pahangi]
MFTSTKFVKDEVMTSTSGSICSPRATGLVMAVDTYTAHDTGQLIAHNLAHIMGMDHDSPDCSCDFMNKCIMHKQAGTIHQITTAHCCYLTTLKDCLLTGG